MCRMQMIYNRLLLPSLCREGLGVGLLFSYLNHLRFAEYRFSYACSKIYRYLPAVFRVFILTLYVVRVQGDLRPLAASTGLIIKLYGKRRDKK